MSHYKKLNSKSEKVYALLEAAMFAVDTSRPKYFICEASSQQNGTMEDLLSKAIKISNALPSTSHDQEDDLYGDILKDIAISFRPHSHSDTRPNPAHAVISHLYELGYTLGPDLYLAGVICGRTAIVAYILQHESFEDLIHFEALVQLNESVATAGIPDNRGDVIKICEVMERYSGLTGLYERGDWDWCDDE